MKVFRAMFYIIILLIFIVTLPVDVYSISQGQNNNLVGMQSELTRKINDFNKTIYLYERRIEKLEDKIKFYDEKLDVYKELVNGLVSMFKISITLIIGILGLLSYFNRLYLQNKLQKYINDFIKDERIYKILKPKITDFTNERQNEFKELWDKYDKEFSKLLIMVRKGINKQ